MNIPAPTFFKQLSKSVATLDAIIMQEWELRYYSHNCHWSPSHEMASMRNGSGDHYFILFTPEGSVVKGISRGATATKQDYAEQRFYDGLPPVFQKPFLQEPAFMVSDVSFVFWRLEGDQQWSARPMGASSQETGSDLLLRNVTGGPESYQHWATKYYEREVPLPIVRAVFEHTPINQAILSKLNPDADIAQLTADLEEIGYPNSLNK